MAIIVVASGMFFSSYAGEPLKNISKFETCIAQRKVVFRSTQRLKARDGRQIYLFSNGKCELWDGDRLIVTTTYTLQDGEVRLLDEQGNAVYKGSYQLAKDGQHISTLTLSGTIYYRI
ncbi:hypothetical protein B5G10_10955 [Barnesiella sp. An55]|nr:hypothetical protein B5G10_10955 [Barnesiella sp. An55]